MDFVSMICMISKTLDLLYYSICFYIFMVEQKNKLQAKPCWDVGGGGGARPQALSMWQVFHLGYFILST